MGYAVQNFRDLLALARLLRRFAQEHIYDGQHELLLDTAAALEVRAFALAARGNLSDPEQVPGDETALHAPVNMVI